MKRILLLLCALMIFTGISFAQVSASLPDMEITTGNGTISVPLNVTDFNNIGAISLKINYDSNVLTFQGTPNPIPGNFSINASNGVITIGWFSLTPLNVGSGTLLNIEFQYNGGNSNLEFVENLCEIADNNGTVLSTSYHNGSVKSSGTSNNTASVGDKVWLDSNGNGILDNNESGLQWVTVELYKCDNTWLGWQHTDSNGEYKFEDLEAGDYYVKFYLIDNYSDYTFSTKDVGGDDAVDSDVYEDSDTSGRTDCFTLSAGENKTNVDAGVKDAPASLVCEIGNRVWKDLNKNGLQENGEPGVPNVSLKLFDSGNSEVATALTDAEGYYLVPNVPAGTYYLSITVPDGYGLVAMDEGTNDGLDSDFDPSTFKTSDITIDTQNCDSNATRWDAGLYVIPAPGNPDIWLTKDDGNLVMPDSGETNMYTISVGNDGTASLLNAVVVDTLPVGTSFMSIEGATGSETQPGILEFNLGTITQGTVAEAKVTVQVTSHESQYRNVAFVSGNDENNVVYTASGEDVNLCDTSSGGGNGGIESKADMAELLLRRHLKIEYGMTTNALAKSNVASISAYYNLPQLIPSVGPFESRPVETTPFDILGISNAVSSYAVDYVTNTNKGDRRVGSIFSTITEAPDIYDHTKAVCDRFGGYEIDNIEMVKINGYEFYLAVLRNPVKRLTDYAVSFSVYETGAGFKVENKWTYDEYKTPDGATNIYNLQVWSSTVDGTVKLVRDALAKFSNLTYMNTNQVEPDVFIKKARYTHDGKIHLTMVNPGQSKQVTLSMKYRIAQGADQYTSEESYTIPAGESTLTIPSGIISDSKIYMTEPGEFRDEVFVSGGAYTYITGGSSTVSDFNTTNYQQVQASENALSLAGGAYIEGNLKDWVSVIRSLETDGTSYDLSNYSNIKFTARGTGVLTVIFDLENTQNFNYYAKNITLTNETKVYELSFSDFSELYGASVPFDVSKVNNVGFILEASNNAGLSNFYFDISNISFGGQITGVENNNEVPDEFTLSQNYPNPFNPSTVIDFTVAKKELVTLRVYDVLGQEVATLINTELQPGKHSVTFNGSNLSSGVYIYRLQSNSVNVTKKMILNK